MGEVFRATDTKLKRQVALKILPALLAADPDRLARFQREAEVLASLNHPNIAGIHGVEEADGIKALVMELVEGPTLADRIARGALPIDEALPIAKQMAEALEAAHEQGIVHRDLKPANIKVRDDGTVKVLDFGLAKAMEPVGAMAVNSMSPTITSPARMTGAGIILGTAAYMSPEQARGKPVDKRADIWAFGCVLYEMLTGRRAFEDEDVSVTLSKVLQREPDFDTLPPAVPARVSQALRICLRKDPKQRVGDIRDVRLALEGAFEAEAPPTAAAASTPARGRRLGWTIAATAVLISTLLAVPAVRYLREPLPPEMRLEITTPATTDPISFALSPDGRQLVFVASGGGPSRLWLRPLASPPVQPLAGTEGASLPFWSPDSRSVGFFADGKLKRLDIGGGQPVPLSDAVPRGGTWNADGIILFTRTTVSALSRVPASGGEAQSVTTLEGQSTHRSPQFLPGGRQFLFYAVGSQDKGGIHLGSLDSPAVKRLTAADTAGVYMPRGWLFWVRGDTLVAQRLDLGAGALTGDPVPVAEPLGSDLSLNLGAISVSGTGLVAYRSGGESARQLTWRDRSGKVLSTMGAPDVSGLSGPRVSRDGRIVVHRGVQGNTDIWLIDGLRTSKLTSDAGPDRWPVWSPDGSQIVFDSIRKSRNLYVKSSAGGGSGTEALLLESSAGRAVLASDWSADGRFLLYQQSDPNTNWDLWVLPLEGDRKPWEFLATTFAERWAKFSPDGRWVAYLSNESGRTEVYVRPFAKPASAGAAGDHAREQWTVSTAGGIYPTWRSDSKELYYLGPDGQMMAVSIAATGTTLKPGTPMALFPTRIVGGGIDTGLGRQYDVAGDGRFLINTLLEDAAAVPITLLLNWTPPAR